MFNMSVGFNWYPVYYFSSIIEYIIKQDSRSIKNKVNLSAINDFSKSWSMEMKWNASACS